MEPSVSPADTTAGTHEGEKKPTTFMSLPAELRTEIYELSGCLEVRQERRGYWRGVFLRGDACILPRTSCSITCRHAKDASSCRRTRMKELRNWPKAYLVINPGSPKVICFNTRRESWEQHDTLACGVPYLQAQKGVLQPQLTKANKKIREETLPIFYGQHTFVARVFSKDPAEHCAEALSWLDTIGPKRAACLRKFCVVFAKKDTGRYLKHKLRPAAEERGVKPEAFRIVRMQYPYIQDDTREIFRSLDATVGSSID